LLNFTVFFDFIKQKMYIEKQNEYLGDCKADLLYDKQIYLSLWKTRWKVWKI